MLGYPLCASAWSPSVAGVRGGAPRSEDIGVATLRYAWLERPRPPRVSPHGHTLLLEETLHVFEELAQPPPLVVRQRSHAPSR